MRTDVQQALEKFKIITFGNKTRIELLEQRLSQTEQVKYISPTNAKITTVLTRKREELPGIFALTTQRILFSYKSGPSHVIYQK